MKKFVVGAVVIGLLMLVSVVAGAQGVYMWVDDNGITSYGETPPDGVDAVRTSVRVHRTDEAALQARLADQQAMAEAVATRERNEQEDADEAQRVAAENKKVRQANCDLARDRQQKYDQAHQLYRETAGGGREYLTSDELDEERAAANRAVSEWCDRQ